MLNMPEELLFDDEHDFHVAIEFEGEAFAGYLSIRPAVVTLRINGDMNDGRHFALPMGNIDSLLCRNGHHEILLFNLRTVSGISRGLGSRHSNKSHFECVYNVEYLIFSKAPIGLKKPFFGVNIHSETISKWIGNTNTQEGIMSAYHNKKISSAPAELFNEFYTKIHNGIIGIDYPTSVYYNSSEFKSGVSFPPVFNFRSSSEMFASKWFDVIKDIICLFSFVTVGKIAIRKIEILYSGRFSANKATILIPNKEHLGTKSEMILYPLGRNLRNDNLCLPEFSDDIFINFFSYDRRNIDLISKYLKYRKFDNVEERFLGFFRILESMAYKKMGYLDEKNLYDLCEKIKPCLIRRFKDRKNVNAFVKRIPSWNMSKYNTEKCLADLLKSIPKGEPQKWIYSSKDLANICKLRNDITHANSYGVSEKEIEDYTIFIEVLLVYSLLVNLGVSAKSSIKICQRVNCYEWIVSIND